MANNFFGSDSSDMALENVRGYIDNTGLMRIKTPNISSYNFDGLVPNSLINITASSIFPGMKISLTGSSDANVYYNVLSVLNEDDFITGSALVTTTIEYLDENSEIQSVVYGASATLPVLYEDWSQKYLGTNGWYISNQGNAIFSNVAVRGEIEATSGKIEELNIGGNYYPIISIIGVEVPSSSAVDDKGQFILTTSSSAVKKLYPGDNARLQGVTASGIYYSYGFPESATNFFVAFDDFMVKTASYAYYENPSDPLINRYLCEVSQIGLVNNYDLSLVTASSGFFTFGEMIFGEIEKYSVPDSEQDIIEGFIFKTVGAGSFWNSYVPDYIDLSGRFRLGGGKLTFDGNNLNVDGNINAKSGSFTGVITASFGKIAGFILGDIGGVSAIKSSNDKLIMRSDGTILLGLGGSTPALYMSGTTPGYKVWVSNSLPSDSPFLITDSGYLISKSSSINNIYVTGSAFFRDVYNTTVTSPRDLQIDSTGKIGYLSSSIKVKNNIIPLLENDLLNIPEDKVGNRKLLDFDYLSVLDLIPVKFDWDNGPSELGFIAEQVGEVFPIAYIDGEIPSYHPKMILPALLAVIKDQQKRIDDLNNRVLQLESQIGG